MTKQIARLSIVLHHLEPRIWRQVEVSLTTNLRSLHEVIQAVMPWEGHHLYRFTFGERVLGKPGRKDAMWVRKIYQAKSMLLGSLIERALDGKLIAG